MRSLRFTLPTLLCTILAVPFFAAAQQGDLQTAIRAALAQDPRSSEMPQGQFDALVEALTAQAEVEGITAHDIAWRPTEDAPAGSASRCSMPEFFCSLSAAFGFDGSDIAIPLALGAASAFLLFIIGVFLHAHGRHPTQGVLEKSQ
jgi:hypothetical protein